MDVDKHRQNTLYSWLFVGVLAALCATLGALQYKQIGEVGRAEHERLRGGLQLSLQRLSQEFNSEVSAAIAALLPGPFWDDEAESEQAYAIRYAKFRGSSRYSGLFRKIVLAVPADDTLHLRNLDINKGTFEAGEWPTNWSTLRDRLIARHAGEPGGFRPFGSPAPDNPTLIDIPRFGRTEGGGPGPRWGDRPTERQWLLLDLDVDYLRTSLLPGLLQRHLGGGEKLDYQVEIVARDNAATLIYQSDPEHASRIGDHSDASVGLFDVQYDQFFRRGDEGRGERGRGGPGPPGATSARGRWLLSVRHRAGSLEAVVEQARRRNVAVAAGILLLMLAAAGALVRFTRRAQRLAELQMEFVAGVSHELRTPLSVIRTASHNLSGGLISNTKQVQRYGALIEQESERLTGIVEQVLLFSNAKAGRAIGGREVVGVSYLIDGALDACARIVQDSRCTVEKHVDASLAPILGDPTALRHALQNLIGNAAKYGSEGGWIGVTGTSSADGDNSVVEIRVADHGPGIPEDELSHIFDTFYRGKRAVEDQIHGTGLGLSLVKRIIEAHQGTVTAVSELGKGTEFVVRIPAAPADQIDEFADTVNRR